MTTLRPALPRWRATDPPKPEARLRLVCLPYAGSGSAVFRAWSSAFPPEVEVVRVVLPGRESRFRELPPTSVQGVVEELVESMVDLSPLPLALFGHSMGALLAFELAHALSPAAPPVRLFVSGCLPPQALPGARRLSDLPDVELLAALEIPRLPGRTGEIHRRMVELMLPTIRADLGACESYAPPPRSPLHVPVVALAGSDDPHAPPDAMAGWRAHTSGPFSLQVVVGQHLFVDSARDIVVRIVDSELRGVA